MLRKIGSIPGHELIKQWLKAGYVEWGKLHPTELGTPQGGVISPLLANIALDGLQNHLGKGYRYVRFADDFVVMAKTLEAIEQALPKIRTWLKERGLELNEEKTRIVRKVEGFNFLGFNVRAYGPKLLIKPQREKVIGKLREIKDWLSKHKTVRTEAVARYLNPVLRGWTNYYRHVVSREIFQMFDNRLWEMLWRWAKRRHPNRGKRWIFKKYFEEGRYGATLYAEVRDNGGKKSRIYLYKMPKTPITRHIKVKGKTSPDDPTLTKYWEERQMRRGKTYLAKGSKLYRIAESQDWKCVVCGNHLFNEEPVDLHHITSRRKGGSDDSENLAWLHEACHYNAYARRMASGQSA